MLIIEGQIGVLYQDGKQVAGIYNWEARVVLQYTTVNSIKNYNPKKKIEARSYWLVEAPEGNVFNAEFYQVVGDQLALMDAGKISVDFPDCKTLDRRLDAPLDLVWIEPSEY